MIVKTIDGSKPRDLIKTVSHIQTDLYLMQTSPSYYYLMDGDNCISSLIDYKKEMLNKDLFVKKLEQGIKFYNNKRDTEVCIGIIY